MGTVSQDRRRCRISAWLVVAAILWSAVLIGLALTLPVYSSGGAGSGSRTLVAVNGTILVVVAIPLLLTVLAGLTIRIGGPNRGRGTNFAVWGAGWILLAYSLVTGFTIGLAVLPAAILTLVAAYLVPESPPSAAPASPANP